MRSNGDVVCYIPLNASQFPPSHINGGAGGGESGYIIVPPIGEEKF